MADSLQAFYEAPEVPISSGSDRARRQRRPRFRKRTWGTQHFAGEKLGVGERGERRDPAARRHAAGGRPRAVGELLGAQELKAASDAGLRGFGSVCKCE